MMMIRRKRVKMGEATEGGDGKEIERKVEWRKGEKSDKRGKLGREGGYKKDIRRKQRVIW